MAKATYPGSGKMQKPSPVAASLAGAAVPPGPVGSRGRAPAGPQAPPIFAPMRPQIPPVRYNPALAPMLPKKVTTNG